MKYEKIDYQYDHLKLLESLKPKLEKFPSVQRSLAVGGWALQSTNNSYTDGWNLDFCPYNGPGNISPSWTPSIDAERKLRAIQDYTLPTEINSNELESLLKNLEDLKLNPRKARIIRLTKNSVCQWHQDGSEKFYQVRLHIPLITNDGCFFETKDERVQMQANGSFYFVHINQLHRVVNYGDQDRYHFVCNIWDQNNFTERHRYSPDENAGETFHP